MPKMQEQDEVPEQRHLLKWKKKEMCLLRLLDKC